jgi:hypothetical protein
MPRPNATRLCVVTCLLALRTVTAPAQWEMASTKGDTIHIGYLAQLRAEWAHAPGTTTTAQNIFLRHLRVQLSGRIRPHISMFLGVDSPNLGKAQSDGTKATPEVGVYDFWITYQPAAAIMFDGGLIGTPNSYNSIQMISGMLASDFSPYSFLSTPPTNSRAGRDYGLQSRGYVFADHLEYRLAIFQGFRGNGATMPFRYVGRVMADLFARDKSMYYPGTGLGVARHLAVGSSIDMQQHYRSVGVDLYADQPIGHGDGLTAQFDAVRYDGGTTFPVLHRQDALLAELGYYIGRLRLTPFAQLASDDTHFAVVPRQEQQSLGIAYFADGQRLNVKASFGRLTQHGSRVGKLVQLTVQNLQF